MARREQKGVGDAAADEQMVRQGRKIAQQFEFAGNLGAADDGEQRPLRLAHGAADGVEFPREQRAGACLGGVPRDAGSARLGAVGGAESVHDEDVAKRGVTRREFIAVGFLASVHAHILQQADRGLGQGGAKGFKRVLKIILHERHIEAEQSRQMCGDRRQGKLPLCGDRYALGRPAEMRHEQHLPGADRPRRLDSRQRRADTAVVDDLAVAQGHVEVFPDQHALAGQVELFHPRGSIGHRLFLFTKLGREGIRPRPACGSHRPIRCRTR